MPKWICVRAGNESMGGSGARAGAGAIRNRTGREIRELGSDSVVDSEGSKWEQVGG